MDKPKLKGVFIGKGKRAEQSGRGVNDYGRLVSRLILDDYERIRLDNFERRLADAWREYDIAVSK